MGGFDDLLDDIEGTGWYQKRLVYFLIGPLFFLMPFAFLNQIFVLTIPGKTFLVFYAERQLHSNPFLEFGCFQMGQC